MAFWPLSDSGKNISPIDPNCSPYYMTTTPANTSLSLPLMLITSPEVFIRPPTQQPPHHPFPVQGHKLHSTTLYLQETSTQQTANTTTRLRKSHLHLNSQCPKICLPLSTACAAVTITGPLSHMLTSGIKVNTGPQSRVTLLLRNSSP